MAMSTITEADVLYALWRKDLRAFFEKVFTYTHHGRTLDPGWHIDAMIFAAEESNSNQLRVPLGPS